MAEKTKEQEQGAGALLRTTLQMAWPAVLESFFVALAGMLDTMMVSGLGDYAVAAVGLTIQPKFIGLTFFIATNIAVSALVARRKGERRQKDANRILLTALAMTLTACVVISLLCVTLAEPIMTLCGSNEETHAAAVLYFRIIMGGMLFNVVSLVINAAQRGSGNTRIAMTTNITSSVVNICCNYLLIQGNLGFPRLEVAGAAIATVMGTVVASVMSLRSLLKERSYVQLSLMAREKLRPALADVRQIFHLSGNVMAEQLVMRIGFVATAVIAAGLGTQAFAAHQVGMNVLALSFAFGDGMQVAAISLTGQALGRQEPELAQRYGSLCQRIGMAISATLCLLFLLFGRWFYSLYFIDPATVEMGVLITRFTAVSTWLQISGVIFMGALRAAGDVRFTLVTGLLGAAVVRTLVTVVLTLGFDLGLAGVWMGIACDQGVRCIMSGIRFHQGNWVTLRI